MFQTTKGHFMNNETIHVNSYTRDDGTKVRDYYRSKPGSGVSYEPKTLPTKAASPETVPETKNTKAGKILSTAVAILKVGLAASSKILNALSKTSNLKNNHTVVIQQVPVVIDSIKQTNEITRKSMQNTLDQMQTTKDNVEYKRLLESYAENKKLLEKNEVTVKRIEYAAQNKDYEGLAEELNTYENDQNEYLSINSDVQELLNPKMQPANLTAAEKPLNAAKPALNNYTGETPVKYSIPNANLPEFTTSSFASSAPQASEDEKAMHKKAEIYRQLCIITDSIVQGRNVAIPYGYEILTMFDGEKQTNSLKIHDKQSNFKAVAYVKGNEIVICFVGTDPRSIKDHGANLKMGTGEPSEQMKKALEFARKIADKLRNQYIIETAGHSEGGSEAIYAGLMLGLQTYTYNAFPLPPRILNNIKSKGGSSDYKKYIVNYRDPHDPISKLFNTHVGRTYITQSTQGKFMRTTPFGSKAAHGIVNMGSCETAIPIEEFKKANPWFVDTVGLPHFTQKGISEIYNAGLMDIYTPYIQEYINSGDIFNYGY